MDLTTLTALTPLDGRYRRAGDKLAPYFSEFGLIKYRVKVEIEWLKALAAEPAIAEVPAFSAATLAALDAVAADFSLADAQAVKTTNHDVKAVEYFIKEHIWPATRNWRRSASSSTSPAPPRTSTTCPTPSCCATPAGVLLPPSPGLDEPSPADLRPGAPAGRPAHAGAHPWPARLPHHPGQGTGQRGGPAAPGHATRFAEVACLGKINGAVGNYNAHLSAYPDLDWPGLRLALRGKPGPDLQPLHHPDRAPRLHGGAVRRLRPLQHRADRPGPDVWGYISLGYFKQKVKEGEVGSSTMPHKVNPIDFENSEGNLGLANAILRIWPSKLPISRWQRDLTDSTVLRNLGVALGYP
jgi:adenylosuccinate lyase